jgi:regulator of protease activity HflC (stomatin/prohibitin superfamily)
MNVGASFTVIVCFLGFVVIVVAVFLASAIRIVPEEKRLKVYRLGRNAGLKGPGLVLLIPAVERGVLIDAGTQIQTPQTPTGTQELYGVARTPVFQDGEVLLGDQAWQAVSDRPIAAGQRVRVKRVVVEVEEV